MKLREIHYENTDRHEEVTNALIEMWRRNEKNGTKILGSELRSVLHGLGFVEQNELANQMIDRGQILKAEDKISEGGELIRIANAITPILPGGTGDYRCSS